MRSIEAPDDHGLQELRFKVAEVHSVTSTCLGLERLPMGADAASLAAYGPQGSIAPDVALRVLGMALDRHGPQRVIGPGSSRAPAQRTVAARGLVGRGGKRELHRSAMAGAVEGRCWLFVIHKDARLRQSKD